MNLRHMEVFHAVYADGSMSAAARRLNVSQPSISKILARAEDVLGFLLFRRLKGRLVPTDEAHVLFRVVDQMQGNLDAVAETARNLRGGLNSYLRLSVLPSLGLAVAPLAVQHLLKSHPKVRVDVQTLHHDELPRALNERDCDLAIGFDALANHPSLHSFKIGRGELVLVYPKAAFPKTPERIPLSAIKTDGFISVTNSGPVGDLLSRALSIQKIELQDRISVRTFYVAAALVCAGVGFAVIDEFTASAVPHDDVAFCRLDPPLAFDVRCIFRADRPPSRLGRAFIDAMSAALRQNATEPGRRQGT
jgi:DNA-binding transcriptional LysR family regulator